MAITVERLDHLVLTVASIETTVAFYETVLGMTAIRFGPDQGRVALRFGEQKISGKVEATGGWRRFVTKGLGRVTIPKAAEMTVKVVPTSKPGEAVMDLRAIEMTKVK